MASSGRHVAGGEGSPCRVAQGMPRLIFIKGCGLMACSSYAEITAAIDRAYEAPAGEPLPLDQVFASRPLPLDPVPGRKETTPEPG